MYLLGSLRTIYLLSSGRVGQPCGFDLSWRLHRRFHYRTGFRRWAVAVLCKCMRGLRELVADEAVTRAARFGAGRLPTEAREQY